MMQLKLAIAITLFFASANSLQAQFLKKILNDVKQTTQNHANKKASDVTGNTIDGMTKSGSNNNSSNIDTAALGGVLGAFAKAAHDNPNDTSMSDLLSKSLGNLTEIGRAH